MRKAILLFVCLFLLSSCGPVGPVSVAATLFGLGGKKKKHTVESLPAKASNPRPVQNAVDVPVTKNLSWGVAARATSYDVYFGTSATAVAAATTTSPEYAGNTPFTMFDPSPGSNLSYDTIYYWRIDSRNTVGVTKGDLWGFTTEGVPTSAPDKVTDPHPADGATNVEISQILWWEAAKRATSYDVYIGTNQAAVENATTTSPEYKGNQSGVIYDPVGNFFYQTTYYWRIDSKNGIGTTKGDVWSFTTENVPPTPPDKVTGPVPASGAVNVPVTQVLSWNVAARAETYDVYFGTNPLMVANADNSYAEFKGNQAGLSYDPPGNLDYNTTYYWRIDSKNPVGTTKGDLWGFTTESVPATPPDKVAGPDPADGATNVPITKVLSWGAAARATSYDVYFGTSNP
ncbi:MAG: hypothetical protein N2234_08905, partial [Planctomycetota bacterium]|nr:hypothetical protein [Planctomycetota bacterium]